MDQSEAIGRAPTLAAPNPALPHYDAPNYCTIGRVENGYTVAIHRVDRIENYVAHDTEEVTSILAASFFLEIE